ncbi:hypothetical protein DPMN_050721 [Dreissena polymorpha]|uniref:Uncharacterized protein n=1 Tax=Dreissena polymorpha TaxID=45954 RepID=A0A9D4CGN9_DREPO|nr:hypothetical protein DPMN_050721 [Dreissena polymorpha]
MANVNVYKWVMVLVNVHLKKNGPSQPRRWSELSFYAVVITYKKRGDAFISDVHSKEKFGYSQECTIVVEKDGTKVYAE